MAAGQQVGYKRVSTMEQSNLRQLDGLTLDRTFEDKACGKDTQRPQLEAALAFIREGDTLVVHSMDRLARNLDDLRRIVLTLTKRGVKVQFIKESLTFTGEDSAMSNLLLSVMGAFAEFERSLTKERQREGIAIAKAEGTVYKGRMPALSEERAAILRSRTVAGESKSKDAVAYCNKAFDSMTDAKGSQMVRLFNFDMAKLTVFSLNTAHTDEHYGNMVTYLRLKGIVPPTSENPPGQRPK